VSASTLVSTGEPAARHEQPPSTTAASPIIPEPTGAPPAPPPLLVVPAALPLELAALELVEPALPPLPALLVEAPPVPLAELLPPVPVLPVELLPPVLLVEVVELLLELLLDVLLLELVELLVELLLATQSPVGPQTGVAPLHAPPGVAWQQGEPSVLTSHSRMSCSLEAPMSVEAVKPAHAWVPSALRSAGPVKSGVAGRLGLPATETETCLVAPSKSIHA
jgi:hypothetical protein